MAKDENVTGENPETKPKPTNPLIILLVVFVIFAVGMLGRVWMGGVLSRSDTIDLLAVPIIYAGAIYFFVVLFKVIFKKIKLREELGKSPFVRVLKVFYLIFGLLWSINILFGIIVDVYLGLI